MEFLITVLFFRSSYSTDEDRAIINYILKKKKYNEVGSNSLWKEMEKEQVSVN